MDSCLPLQVAVDYKKLKFAGHLWFMEAVVMCPVQILLCKDQRGQLLFEHTLLQ